MLWNLLSVVVIGALAAVVLWLVSELGRVRLEVDALLGDQWASEQRDPVWRAIAPVIRARSKPMLVEEVADEPMPDLEPDSEVEEDEAGVPVEPALPVEPASKLEPSEAVAQAMLAHLMERIAFEEPAPTPACVQDDLVFGAPDEPSPLSDASDRTMVIGDDPAPVLVLQEPAPFQEDPPEMAKTVESSETRASDVTNAEPEPAETMAPEPVPQEGAGGPPEPPEAAPDPPEKASATEEKAGAEAAFTDPLREADEQPPPYASVIREDVGNEPSAVELVELGKEGEPTLDDAPQRRRPSRRKN